MAVTLDFDNELALNWNPDFMIIGKPVPPNAMQWGLKILDWDGNFTKRLKRLKVSDLTIPFQYLEAIPNWDKGADWKDVGEIMGRFESPSIYASSNTQEFSFNIIYYAEALYNEGAKTHWTLENIEVYVKRLQSLVFPQYDGKYSPPMKLLFNIGNIYKDIPVVIKNVSVESMPPYDTLSGLPRMRKISVSARVSYPMYQGIGQMSVYTAFDGVSASGKKGTEVFAYESLDKQWKPGTSSTNPWNTEF